MHTSKLQFDIIVLFIIFCFIVAYIFYVLLYMYVNCLQLPTQFLFYYFYLLLCFTWIGDLDIYYSNFI